MTRLVDIVMWRDKNYPQYLGTGLNDQEETRHIGSIVWISRTFVFVRSDLVNPSELHPIFPLVRRFFFEGFRHDTSIPSTRYNVFSELMAICRTSFLPFRFSPSSSHTHTSTNLRPGPSGVMGLIDSLFGLKRLTWGHWGITDLPSRLIRIYFKDFHKDLSPSYTINKFKIVLDNFAGWLNPNRMSRTPGVMTQGEFTWPWSRSR